MKDIKSAIREEYNSKTNPYYSVDLDYLKTSVMNAAEKEITKTNDELEKLKNDLEKFPSLYCDKYGHSYVTTNYRYLGRTGWGSILGEERVYEIKEECTVCGKTYYIPALELYYRPDTCVCKKQLPEDLYHDQSLQIDGKTYQMTEAEISRLEDYLEYINSIKSTIFSLIDYTMERQRQYRILKRSKILSWNNYIDFLKRYPIIYSIEVFLTFPTFEEYQNQKQHLEKTRPVKRERKP